MLDLLAAAPVFASAAPTTIEAVAARARERAVPKGSHVCLQGDDGDHLFVVKSGLLRAYVSSPDGDELALALLRRPESFGEIAVLDGLPRAASVVALRSSVVVAVDRATFLDALARDPVLLGSVARTLALMARRNSASMADLSFVDIEGRVARRLLDELDRDPDRPIQISQAELAKLVGATRQSVNQVLQRLARSGTLDVHDRLIEVVDERALRGIAGG